MQTPDPNRISRLAKPNFGILTRVLKDVANQRKSLPISHALKRVVSEHYREAGRFNVLWFVTNGKDVKTPCNLFRVSTHALKDVANGKRFPAISRALERVISKKDFISQALERIISKKDFISHALERVGNAG